MKKSKGFYNNNLKYYFEEIKKNKLLTAEEEIELANKIKKGDKSAFNKMISSNLRLVIKIAKRYSNPDFSLDDLIQEGNIGLMKAVEKFDPEKKVRFSTYASWWIKQAIIRAITNKKRLIRIPYRKEEYLRKINYIISELSQELNREPSIKEIAERLNCSEIDIINIKNITDNIYSIDGEVNEEGFSLLECIDDDSFSPERVLDLEDLRNKTDEIFESLKNKEREVLLQRFAFDSKKKETLKSIARNLGISPETVRQLEIRAIKKIRSNYSFLKDYLCS
ncbi:MAG TPA: sigma-70 family RNA polymerase sigma factor [Spirochaetota bacterium]|nr:sigma-70 family RNA polymerase sigma factor [Spirochaetota bacterium]HOL57659.1 sigma-70 family RNA polymerase sigma factor [Spirochaetota bacterium]HPP05228.1 sigma-70 family RNA polymerase sigma factor [Spirochaetota bacterium]